MSRKRKVLTSNICCFCQREPDDKNLGKFFVSSRGFAVHQYCMFFSANLPQNGKDEEGFEGFLESDIMAEYRRASRMGCCVCRQKGASAGCFMRSCKKSFHYPCGISQKYLFQFFGEFRAYCCDHRLQQQNLNASSPSEIRRITQCVICLEDVQCCCTPDVLKSPCCKNTWFHRTCLQEQAAASGYFFRCPVCNDVEQFRKEMKYFGIYVPDRDAAWEEGGNFEDLLEKYERCDCIPCKCPSGNMFSSETGPWEIVLCSSCGQYGVHVGCQVWEEDPPSFYCPTCIAVHNDNDDVILTQSKLFSPAESLSGCQVESCRGTSHKTIGNIEGRRDNRRDRLHLKKKRVHEDSEDDNYDDHDISNILSGLTRHDNEDLLDMDTRLVVQRALAAGKAATDTSMDKACNTRLSHNSCMQHRHGEHGISIWSPGPDDDCVITKYIPGDCRVCPNCHRRKPPKRPNHQTTPPSASSTTVSSTCHKKGAAPSVTSSSMTSSHVTPPSRSSPKFPRKTLLSTPSLTSASSTSSSHTSSQPTTARSGKANKMLGWMENAQNSINSLFSNPWSDTQSTSKKEDRTAACDVACSSTSGSGVQKESGRPRKEPQTLAELVNDVTSSSQSPSFFASSVEKIFQLLNPRSTSAITRNRSGDDGSGSDRSVSSTQPSRLLEPTSVDGCSLRDGNCRVTDQFASQDNRKLAPADLEHQTSSLGSNTEEFLNASRVTRSKNRLSFPRSDPEKTVFEAAMDHAYELRSSGKELTHQCVTSF